MSPKHIAKYRKIKAFEEESKGEKVVPDFPLIGSEAYTPPEVVQDAESKLNPAYDVWQLGLIIIEMLTGKEPWHEFHGDTDAILKNLEVTDITPSINMKISKD